jgi:hypothetical protein
MFCAIDKHPIPDDRSKRKGLASVTCSDDCYRELRKRKKDAKRSYRFDAQDRALLLRLKRVKFSISDFPAFTQWWGALRKTRQSEPGAPKLAADSARCDLNVSA